MTKPEVFISFKHEDQSFSVRDALVTALEAAGFRVIVDKDAVQYGESFRSFMDRLGKGKFIVPIISDAYLKSENCLYEILRMREAGNLDDRVFPIILPDAAKIFKADESLTYLRYWEDRIKSLEDAVKGLTSLGFVQESLGRNDEFIQYRQMISALVAWLQPKNTSSLDALSANNFAPLIQAIERQRSAEKEVMNLEWDEMIDGILDGRSVLFLGPEILSANGKESGKSAYYRELARQYNQYVIRYNEEDELFLLRNESGADFKIRRMARKYFQEVYKPDAELISKIMEIPFGIYVSMTPDLTLANEIKNYTTEADFFSVELQAQADASQVDAPSAGKTPPTPQRPMVFNLMGSVNKEESIVLTHNDLFNYLKVILPENIIPAGILEYLDKATGFIFLGFQFDKWYTQLLLRLFSLHQKGSSNANRHSPTERTSGDTINWCREDFKVIFIQSGVQEFVDELRDSVRKKAGEDGMRKRRSDA